MTKIFWCFFLVHSSNCRSLTKFHKVVQRHYSSEVENAYHSLSESPSFVENKDKKHLYYSYQNITVGWLQFDIHMTFKIVHVVASTYDRRKIMCQSFPQPKLANCNLCVSLFKRLGQHTFCNSNDVNREIKCLLATANVLIRRFSYCSMQVKLKLFNSYCLCFGASFCLSVTCGWSL